MLDEVCKSLTLHKTRERTLRLLQYSSLLVSSTKGLPNELRDFLTFVYSKCSETRIILRFFDGIPMLKQTLSYGLGTGKEPDSILQLLGFLSNIFDQLYYPTENIGWLVDNGVVGHHMVGGYQSWTDLSNVCWALSLLMQFLKAVRYITLIMAREREIQKDKNIDEATRKQARRDLDERKFFHFLSLVQSACDFSNAVHYIPEPFLWSGQLSRSQVGLFGTISSIIFIYKSYKYN